MPAVVEGQDPAPVPASGNPLLDGMSLVELGSGLPLAYAGKVLASAGADVIKVEPSEGDPLRAWARPPGQDFGPLFEYLNAGKRSVVLDLEREDGRAALVGLLRERSALVHSLLPASAEALGLNYAGLHEINPALLVASITPYGATGPYRDLPGTELTQFALSSRLKAHGSPGREPISYAPEVLEYQIGVTAAVGILAGIVEAEASGQGQDLDLSGAEALTGNVDTWLWVYAYSGHKTPRSGATHPISYPMGVYPVADGYVLIMGGLAGFFERLCTAIGHPEIPVDERWRVPQNRAAHRDEFHAILLPWLLERSRQEVFDIFQGHRVLCAPVLTLDAALTDPQMQSRGSLVTYQGSPFPNVVYPGRPFILSDAAGEPTVRAPHLGEHNHLLEAQG